MNFILKNFLRGLVILVPIAVTIYIVYASVRWVDRLVDAPIPGVGFAAIVGITILVGAVASSYIIRKLLALTEAVFVRAPIIRIVYFSIRDLIEAFVGDRKKFDRPVLVRLSELGDAKALGFVTRSDIAFLPLHDHVAVYFPQSYNVAGNLILVPADRVQPIEVDSAQLMAFIVSGGVSGL
ncbi:MAG TPA: DUF502 domain-containing protein [Thermoanaerobaculia bacterium]